MDAFYASVEVLSNPSLRGFPIIVGGDPSSRSVVCSASYEARKYGIRSAMACSIAKRLCPKAIFVSPNFIKYKEVSSSIHAILQSFTSKIEAVALDEAWLDVTENKQNIPSATLIAKSIKNIIKNDLNLSCSAGVSFNKFISKIASDEDKPDGLLVITPDDASLFLNKLEIRKIPGVGKVTQKRLESLGIKFGYQLLEKQESFLVDHFGKMGSHLFNIIRGIDNRPVAVNRKRKSISVENTFAKDIGYGETLLKELQQIVDDLILRMKKASLIGKTLTLKVKFEDFSLVTRSITRNELFCTYRECFDFGKRLLNQVCNVQYKNKHVRLVGIGVSNLVPGRLASNRIKQLDFFHLLK